MGVILDKLTGNPLLIDIKEADLDTALQAKINTSPNIVKFSSTGNGSVVGVLKLTTFSDIYLQVLNGNAKFYSDLGGTQDESLCGIVYSGTERTLYIKCTSGASDVLISNINAITNFGDVTNNGWESTTNAPSLEMDLSKLINAESIHPLGNNTFYGDLSGLTNLKRIGIIGGATLTGDISTLTSLNYFHMFAQGVGSLWTGDLTNIPLTDFNISCNNTISGNISSKTALTTFSIQGNNTVDVDITNLTNLVFFKYAGLNSISGSITNLTYLTHFEVYGANTISGSITNLTSLNFLLCDGTNTLSGLITNLTALTYLCVGGSNTISGLVDGLVNLTYVSLGGQNIVTGLITDINATYLQFQGKNHIDTYVIRTFPNNMNTVWITQENGHAFDASEIDKLLIDLSSVANWVGNKTIYVPFPNAGRTSASDAAVTTLQGKGVNVYTNN